MIRNPSTPAPARQVALKALGIMRREKIYARDALEKTLERYPAKPRDRALSWRLVMGATGARGTLKALVWERLDRPHKVEPRVFDALVLAAFELLYLQTPVAVAVNEGVALVRSLRPQAAKLANAVLRRLAPLRAKVAQACKHVESGQYRTSELALVSGLPEWLAALVRHDLGDERAGAFGLCTLEPAPAWVVTLAASAKPELQEATLRAAELKSKVEDFPGIWRVESPARLDASGVLGHGFAAEDLFAYAVALLSVPRSGASRLEVGVGRGTKALVAARELASYGANMADGSARLVGVDANQKRLAEARRRFAATGVDATLLLGDGRDLASVLPSNDERFGLVMIDAPCSGTGTLRRHPEIAWHLGQTALDGTRAGSLVDLQRDLLLSAQAVVAPKGLLAYSTCSVLDGENTQQIAGFLASSAGADFSPITMQESPGYARLPQAAQRIVDAHTTPEGFFATSPAIGSPDGHFLALLRRSS